jgi:hypothetical protein
MTKKRFLILLLVFCMASAYLSGTIVAAGRADSVRAPTSLLPAQQWAAVQAANALLLGSDSFAVYLPIQMRK